MNDLLLPIAIDPAPVTVPTARVAGIDPGAGGALALLDQRGELLELQDMPVIEVNGKRRVVAAGLREIISTWRPTIAIVERVISISKQSATGALNFGYSAGIVEGVLTGMDVPLTLAYPVTWKRAMGVSGDKGGCRLAASRMWPQWHRSFARVKDDGRSEAALLAAYQVMQWTARSSC